MSDTTLQQSSTDVPPALARAIEALEASPSITAQLHAQLVHALVAVKSAHPPLTNYCLKLLSCARECMEAEPGWVQSARVRALLGDLRTLTARLAMLR